MSEHSLKAATETFVAQAEAIRESAPGRRGFLFGEVVLYGVLGSVWRVPGV